MRQGGGKGGWLPYRVSFLIGDDDDVPSNDEGTSFRVAADVRRERDPRCSCDLS